MTTVTQGFARFAVGGRKRPLPTEVVHHAKRALIDWHASVYPGFGYAPLQQLIDVVADDLDRGPAQLASGRAATLRAAALVNGAAAHAAEVDDSFRDAMYHPGAATIAAALAVAQTAGASGAALLRGVVVGYEVSTRIGVALGRAHYRHWHNTGTVGTFGAAAAAAELLDLDESAFAHALATAATFASGLQQAFRNDSMSKPLHPGRAAESGALAAQLAARGVTGSLDIFEGEVGFGHAYGAGGDWATVHRTLGNEFHITRLTFKNHIGCGHAFPAIDGALALQRAHGIDPAAIERIDVATYRPALEIAGHAVPTNGNEARFGIPYMVARALIHGSVRMAAYEPSALDDPRTRALLTKVRVTVDPAIDAAFPGRRSAHVEIVLRDGRSFTHLQPDRRGDPEDPLDDRDLGNKLLELATPVIGEAKSRALLARLWAIDTAATVSGFY